MKILVLDNYDSFTFNLVQYLQELLNRKIDVFRNDALSLEEAGRYDTIILSPGPGLPSEAGIMPALIRQYAPSKNFLGVCLGHQAIGEAFGGELENLAQVFHGIETPIQVVDKSDVLFKDIPGEFRAGRYHSWIVRRENLPESLVVTAQDENGVIMSMRHREFPVWGVQFHPESIMTECGRQLLDNFLTFCDAKAGNGQKKVDNE